ncbi:MAG: hypothetical protein ACREOO_24925, partial [bacterium]
PQFAVANYGLLLLASIRAYGAARTDDYLPLPKWRDEIDRRPSALDILAQFRREVMVAQLGSDVECGPHSNTASEKLLPATESTGFVITPPTSSSKVDLPVSIIAAPLYADA